MNPLNTRCFVSSSVSMLKQSDDDMIWYELCVFGIKGNIGCGLNVVQLSALVTLHAMWCGECLQHQSVATVFVFIFPFLYIIKQLVFSECSSRVRFAFLFVVDIDYIISWFTFCKLVILLLWWCILLFAFMWRHDFFSFLYRLLFGLKAISMNLYGINDVK